MNAEHVNYYLLVALSTLAYGLLEYYRTHITKDPYERRTIQDRRPCRVPVYQVR